MGAVDAIVARSFMREVAPQKAASEKAVTGAGVRVWDYGVPIGQTATAGGSREPRAHRAFMREALGVYHTDRHIKRAERVIAGRVAGLPWHLEDAEGNEVKDDESSSEALAVRDLLEKPTGGQRVGAQPTTWRELAGLTVRHAGLVNVAFWYLDEIDRLAGWPKRILYIRPDRMTPAVDANGELAAWSLDQGSDGKGTRLELAEVLVFYVEPPDTGFYGDGLVEAALNLARKTRLADRHEIDVLDSGGRLAGIISPKLTHIGQNFEPDAFDRLQVDVRNIVDMPDAAKRTIVSRAPVDFIPTAADLEKLQTEALGRLTREEKFGLWGVHPEVAGFPGVGGLNSGERGNYQEATTWQNGCQPRADMLKESLQFQLLDRLARLGLDLQFKLDEPTFDDDMPKYDMAQKAEKLPLTQKERREILGLEPFGDDRDDEVWVGDKRIYPAVEPAPPVGSPQAALEGAVPVSSGQLTDEQIDGILDDVALEGAEPLDLEDD